MTKFYIRSQGCPCNLADSKKIIDYLKQEEHTIVNSPEDADKIIVVTCGFNELKLRQNLDELKVLKSLKGKELFVAGCIPKISSKLLTNYKIIGNPKDFKQIQESTRNPSLERKNEYKQIDDISPIYATKDMKYIRVATGCIGKCSYCAIKNATGFVSSRTISSIITDIKDGIKEGYKKFVLIGEDIGSWGRDIGLKLSSLIFELIAMPEHFELSMTSISPKTLITDPELIKLYSSKKISPTIYAPLQSASNSVLERMNREYTYEEYVKLINKLKEIRPDMKLQTDLLIGFPNETEQDFIKNKEFIVNNDIDFLQVFMYTPMPNTLSYKMKDLAPKIKESRTREIIELFLNKNKNEQRLLVNTNIKY